MLLKHKIVIFFTCVFMLAGPICANSLSEIIKKAFSFGFSEAIFSGVNKNILGSIKAKKMRYFLPNKIEVDDIEVLDEFSTRVLYAKHVKLSISLTSLISKNIVITDAHVEAPYFNYNIKKSIHNVIRLFESVKPEENTGKKESKYRVSVSNLRVANGSFAMQHDAGVEIAANGISAIGSLWIEDGPFRIDISQANIRSGNIKTRGMQLPISDLVAKNLIISDELVFTDDLTALYEKAKISAKGTVFIDEDRYDLKASIEAPENTYPRGLSRLPFIAPKFAAKVTMTGPLEDPQIATDVAFGSTDFNGLKVVFGSARGQINSNRIVVEKSSLRLSGGGEINADGLVDLDKENFIFSSSQKRLLSTELIRFLDVDLKITGKINANTELKGDLFKKNLKISIATKGQLQNLNFEEIKFQKDAKFDVKLDYTLGEKVEISRGKLWDDFGLDIWMFGSAHFSPQQFKFTYHVQGLDSAHYLPEQKNGLSVNAFISKGNISGAGLGKYVIDGHVSAREVYFEKNKINEISSNFLLVDKELKLSKLKAVIFDGDLTGEVAISDIFGQKNLLGNLLLKEIELSHIKKNPLGKNLSGKMNAKIELGQNLNDPGIKFSAEFKKIIWENFAVSVLEVEGQYFNKRLDLSNLKSFSTYGSIYSDNIFLDTSSKNIGGTVRLDSIDLASLLPGTTDSLSGLVSGSINITGTTVAPKIKAPFQAKNLGLFGLNLGSGNLVAELNMAHLSGSTSKKDLILSVSSNLKKDNSQSKIQAAFAFGQNTINAQGKFNDVDFDTASIPMNPRPLAANGKLSGTVLAFGKLSNIDMIVDLVADRYKFYNPNIKDDFKADKIIYGPAILSGQLKQKLLDLSFSMSLDNDKDALSLNIKGPFQFNKFDLKLDGEIDSDHLEDIFFDIKNELLTVHTNSNFSGFMRKNITDGFIFKIDMNINKLLFSLPSIPRIELESPTIISLSNNRFSFLTDAIFNFFPGQLNMAGHYSPEKVDLKMSGSIPLVLSRLITPMVQRADGLASGTLALTGTSKQIIMDGNIVPEPGSTIRFRKWLEPMEFKSGSISFESDSKTSFTSNLEQLKLGLGDGSLFINGTFSRNYKNSKNKKSSTLNLEIEGSNVVIRNERDFIESDFKLTTVIKNKGESLLSGQIVVTDGQVHRDFDLRNFVAVAEKEIQQDTSKFLESIDMGLNIEIGLRQFYASARMLNFDMKTELRGELNLGGLMAKPKFKGALIISEGQINFPSAEFDLSESRIDLDETSKKIFDPKISLIATREFLYEEYNPWIKKDTVIELSLSGTTERLNLDLKPISGQLDLSRTKIFLLLLLPKNDRGNQAEALKRGAQNAAMALSGEVFLRPLTNELQSLLTDKTNTKFRFGSALDTGSVSLILTWELGPRVEAQGYYMFLTGDQENKNLDENHPFGDLKLKLLLFDHRPFGPLSMETSFSAKRVEGQYEPRGVLRMKYTVLSK